MIKNIFLLIILFSTFYVISFSHSCIHDHYAHQHKKHYYNDLQEKRVLQEAINGKIRIFADYTQLTVGGPTQINMIKRIINITSIYFYNTLNVTRLQRLFFPKNVSTLCNSLTVPDIYVKNGVVGDLGVIVGNEENSDLEYVAKSNACAVLQSNNRPIWGSIMFNNAFLEFNQVGFQQNLYVGIHEMTHVLGFSASMFSLYPKGNPLVQLPNGDNYLSSEALLREAKNHFGCDAAKGVLLEDQDGKLIGSHWERKLLGNQFMTASTRINAFISRFTLALLQSSGWYTFVNYKYAESTTWGKNKGCTFFNIDNCNSQQFCSGNNFDCDWTGISIGRCLVDPFAGSCQIIRYYTQTICIDEDFELKNLNAPLNAMERGGSNSKCFISNFKSTGNIQLTVLNNRCYISVCSATVKYIFILIGQSILTCRTPGQKISAPIGLQGTLTCPRNFDNYCRTKPTCPYHCNKNGACINGQCLCTGNKQLTPTCLDVSIYDAPIGSTGGFLRSLKDSDGQLILANEGVAEISNKVKPIILKYSMNKKCMTGTVIDKVFGECLKCKQVFNCQNCDESGCYKCDNGRAPNGGKC